MILCGGRGTRLQEHTQAIPKPLVEIGGMPIVWHVIQLYAVQGFRRFLLATGYRGELIERFVATHTWPEGVSVECVKTGLQTQTGGRIKLLEPRLAGEQLFCATYADGLADIDLDALLSFHREHGALASMTVVRPQLQFGVTELAEDGRVRGFREKPTSRALDQRRLLLLRGGRARSPAARQRARARAARAAGGGRGAARIPSRGLLGVHGHLQGRRVAQRPVGVRAGALARFAAVAS